MLQRELPEQNQALGLTHSHQATRVGHGGDALQQALSGFEALVQSVEFTQGLSEKCVVLLLCL